jgi:NADH-quinone oxidoreductase subunit J
MMETFLVYLFAGSALVAAVLMLVLRHPMRVALALVGCMLSLAGVYALLNVHVIAVFQVLIYVGAVMVFMVYAIMLLDVRDVSFTQRFSGWVLPGIGGLVVLLAILVGAIWNSVSTLSAPSGNAAFALKPFSVTFLADYWLHFELVSVLLVAAVVAALAVLQIGRRNRG